MNNNNSKKEENNLTNVDYVNAFVAMGGDFDGEGYILKNELIKTINDFGIKIDLEEILNRLIERQDEKINFQTFCILFENNIDDNKSIHSFVSVY